MPSMSWDRARSACSTRRTRTLRLSRSFGSGQQAFQLATQIAILELDEAIRSIVGKANFTSDELRGLARIGLANYFAGALIMPYSAFLTEAERCRYDIELLSHRFGVGFETICHRLEHPAAPQCARGAVLFHPCRSRRKYFEAPVGDGFPFFPRRRAPVRCGMSMRPSPTPRRILTQLARMPDERTYLWIARTVSHGRGGYGAPAKTFAVALGCDVRHAERIVYSQGLRIDPSLATPIGMGCKVCERPGLPAARVPAGRPEPERR